LYSKGKKTQKENLAHVFDQDMSNVDFQVALEMLGVEWKELGRFQSFLELLGWF
jgi:hypothetical protein